MDHRGLSGCIHLCVEPNYSRRFSIVKRNQSLIIYLWLIVLCWAMVSPSVS
jgi:hypothetical protein